MSKFLEALREEDIKKQKLRMTREEFKEKATTYWKDILAKWEPGMRSKRKVRQLVKAGVPSSARPQVWQHLIGNDLKISPDLYKIYRARAISNRMAAKTAAEAAAAASQRSQQELLDQEDGGEEVECEFEEDGKVETNVDVTVGGGGGGGGESGESSTMGPPRISTDCVSGDALISASSSTSLSDDDSSLAGPAIQQDLSELSHLRRDPQSADWSEENGELAVNLEVQLSLSDCEGTPKSASAVGTPTSTSTARSAPEIGSSIRQPTLRVRRKLARAVQEGQEVNREQSAQLIIVDLHRTFPALQFFQEGGPYYETLHEILEVYAMYRPDIGYVQGMSYVAAMLLLYEDTYQAFVCLANMLNSNHFLSFYRMDPAQIDVYMDSFTFYMNEFMPQLAKHFEAQGISPRFFLLDWFMTLFCKSLPLDTAAHIWDRYLLDGEPFLFRAALGILKHFEPQLLTSDFDQCMAFLTHLPSEIDDTLLFESIQSVKLHRKTFKTKWTEFAKKYKMPTLT